jgi:outer membrane receptor protein involved in Fe transport
MRKRNVILRDAFGFNLSDGRTRHRGIEVSGAWRIAPEWEIDANVAYAIQRYDFSRALAGGETIVRGDEIDTAPRWLGGLRLRHAHRRLGEFELEAVHQGDYFVDAANSATYPGHSLWHLRWGRALGPRWRVTARLMNLADRRYAERADLAFGELRYFPGAPRSLFVGLEYRGD